MLPVQGVGLAAMQVYSEFRRDGSWVDSNWGRWIRSLERIEWLKSKGLLSNERELVHFVASRACEFESHWPEDFRLWLDHGVNGVRLNAPWARINPERGKFDQEELSNLAAMPTIGKQMGLSKPAMTWYHWQMPGWADDIGSWKNPDMPKYFEDFVYEGMQRIGNMPMLHTIINEPTVDAMFTRRWRRWLAHKLGDVEYMEMLERLAEAHIRARKIILSIAPESEISIAHATTWNDTNVPALKKYWDDEGYFFIDLLRDMGGPDVINRLGLNLYFRRTGNRGQDVRAGWDGQVSYSPNQVFSDVCELTNGLKWEMCPEVLYHVPLAYWQKYGYPIYITEHGYPIEGVEDYRKCWAIAEGIEQLHRCAQAGVDLLGIYWWAGLDNFEWGEGWGNFGLVHVDRKTQERKPKKSLEFLRDCVAAGGLTPEVRERWAPFITRPLAP